MNDKNPMSREEQLLKSTAQQVNPSPSFTNELEKKLMNAHKPAKPGLFSVRKIAFTAGWAVGTCCPEPDLCLGHPLDCTAAATRRRQHTVSGWRNRRAQTTTASTPEGKSYDTSVGQFIMTVDLARSRPAGCALSA